MEGPNAATNRANRPYCGSAGGKLEKKGEGECFVCQHRGKGLLRMGNEGEEEERSIGKGKEGKNSRSSDKTRRKRKSKHKKYPVPVLLLLCNAAGRKSMERKFPIRRRTERKQQRSNGRKEGGKIVLSLGGNGPPSSSARNFINPFRESS